MLNSLFIEIDVLKGTTIAIACSQAKELSELLKRDFTFDFNGVKVTTENKSISDMINGYMVKTQ